MWKSSKSLRFILLFVTVLLGGSAPGSANSAAIEAEITKAQHTLGAAQKIFGPDAFEVAQPLNNLAVAYSNAKQYEPAELLYERAISIYAANNKKSSANAITTLTNLVF
jgi:Tetratricopeptide repeat